MIMYRRKCGFCIVFGELAQMVERSLSMREVGGSIPPFSTLKVLRLLMGWCLCFLQAKK